MATKKPVDLCVDDDCLSYPKFPALNYAAFSPNGKRVVLVSSDHTARIWDTETGKLIGEPLVGHNDTVNTANFSPDGRLVITSSKDGTARIWDATTGKAVGKPLVAHQWISPYNSSGRKSGVKGATFSPDGKWIVMTYDDFTANVWAAESYKSQRIFANTKELIDQARAAAPRCLTPEQRKEFSLGPEPPPWCIEMEKVAVPKLGVEGLACRSSLWKKPGAASGLDSQSAAKRGFFGHANQEVFPPIDEVNCAGENPGTRGTRSQVCSHAAAALLSLGVSSLDVFAPGRKCGHRHADNSD
jgi:dipeptidyl aminopeptidase/acylaminoacyl peptidase